MQEVSEVFMKTIDEDEARKSMIKKGIFYFLYGVAAIVVICIIVGNNYDAGVSCSESMVNWL